MVCNSPCSRVREGSIHPGPVAAMLSAEGNISQCTLGLVLQYSRGISRLFGKTGQNKKTESAPVLRWSFLLVHLRVCLRQSHDDSISETAIWVATGQSLTPFPHLYQKTNFMSNQHTDLTCPTPTLLLDVMSEM